MRLRSLSVLLLLALAGSSLHAAAQGAPTITITIMDMPPGPAQVNAGATHTVSFSVNVQGSGFQCTQPGAINIGLAITNAGAAPVGVTASVDPTNITIDVAPGVYGLPAPSPVPLPVGPPINQTTPATLRVVTTVLAAGTFAPSVTASFAGGSLGPGCVGDPPAASATQAHTVQIQAASGNQTTPPGSPPSPPGPGGNNTTAPPPPPPAGLPGFEPIVLAGAGAIALLVRRRRD